MAYSVFKTLVKIASTSAQPVFMTDACCVYNKIKKTSVL